MTQIPTLFICPISKLIYYDPVIGSDGNCYEYELIKKWVATNNTSPLTRNLMTEKYFYYEQLKKRIKIYVEKNSYLVHKNNLYNYDYYILEFIQKKKNNILLKITSFNWQSLNKLKNWDMFLLDLDTEVISNLIRVGENKNELIDVRYPIHFLCKNYNNNIIKIAIENNYNIELSFNKWKSIHYVINYNPDIKVLELLIKHNVDLEAELNNKMRPIHLACARHKLDHMRLLLEHNININTSFYNNNTFYKNIKVFIIFNNINIEQEKKEMKLIYNYQ